ncbi:MAG: metallopeptidase family protein [Phycisphaerales bacterium]|nr:metallopeptidase family protein [Phycisphaerales bacterium]
MTFDEFLAALEGAIAALPNDVIRVLDNVAFVAEDGEDDGPLGEYFGIPLVDRTGDPTGMLPDKIVLYHRAIENECGGDAEAMREEIRRTLWHEIGHHVGWDDDALEHAEIARGWREEP